MTHLTLKPWELPRGCTAPLSAPADIVVPAEKPVALRFVELIPGSFVLFGCDGAENLIFLAPSTGIPQRWSERRTAEQLENWISSIFESHSPWHSGFGRFGRVFVVDEVASGQQGICINEYFSIKWLAPDLKSAADFRFGPQRLLTEEIQQELSAALNDPTTEAAFAWKWSQMDLDAKQKTVLFSHRERAELHQLVRWILMSSAEIWKDAGMWMWSCEEEVQGRHIFKDDDYFRSPLRITPPYLIEWSRLLDKHFLPLADAELASRFLCTRSWHHVTKWVRAEKPTAHERLEALVNLKEWVERHREEMPKGS